MTSLVNFDTTRFGDDGLAVAERLGFSDGLGVALAGTLGGGSTVGGATVGSAELPTTLLGGTLGGGATVGSAELLTMPVGATLAGLAPGSTEPLGVEIGPTVVHPTISNAAAATAAEIPGRAPCISSPLARPGWRMASGAGYTPVRLTDASRHGPVAYAIKPRVAGLPRVKKPGPITRPGPRICECRGRTSSPCLRRGCGRHRLRRLPSSRAYRSPASPW